MMLAMMVFATISAKNDADAFTNDRQCAVRCVICAVAYTASMYQFAGTAMRRNQMQLTWRHRSPSSRFDIGHACLRCASSVRHRPDRQTRYTHSNPRRSRMSSPKPTPVAASTWLSQGLQLFLKNPVPFAVMGLIIDRDGAGIGWLATKDPVAGTVRWG